MKVLITGSQGQLGKELLKNIPNDIEVIPTDRETFNLLDLKNCREFIFDNKPDWIINAAAYTAVDLAEDEKEIAMIINSEAPTEIAKTLKKTGGKLLHISTDFVFDGKSKSPYKVEDEPDPINIYGKSKLLGEKGIKNILQDNNQYIILRTSWVMGSEGNNFAKTMLKLLKIKDNISVVNDQIGCMTSSKYLSIICWLIIQKDITININNQKIFHWTDAGVSSWFEIASEIRRLSFKLNLLSNPAKVIPISSNNFPTKAKRPNFSLLDCSATKEVLNIENNHWHFSLLEILQELKSKNFLM